MNEAIKIAIKKGGYKSHWRDVIVDIAFIHFTEGEFNIRASWMLERILLDPLFWQALGKALGWKLAESCCEDKSHWLHTALDYHELVLTGGDTEKFWNQVINQPITEPTIVQEGQVVKLPDKEER